MNTAVPTSKWPHRRRMHRYSVIAVAVLAVSLVPSTAGGGVATDGPPARVGDIVPETYIVTLDDSASLERVMERNFIAPQALAATYREGFLGFTARMPAKVAARLAEDPRVLSVEPDRWLSVQGVQSSPPWGLDRTDERELPRSGTYEYGTTGAGVTTYVVDTGVRSTHVDFAGRVAPGFDATGGGSTWDCNGHGTHVAGTIAGSTYGVAKAATVVPVKVMYCDGAGTASEILAGMDWVAQHHQQGTPAVANMSLASDQRISAVDTAVRAGIADGITYVLAAGNANVDACGVSPANVVEAITVGASDRTDTRASFSNYGPCLDLFAPGTGVRSAWHTSDGEEVTLSGTSMAAPHVAGVAARYLQSAPSAMPAEVGLAVTEAATSSIVSSAGPGSPTTLLYAAPPSTATAWKASPTPASSLSLSASTSALTHGESVTLRGRMTSDGDGVPFERVLLQRRRVGTTRWRLVATETTDEYGRVVRTLKPAASVDYRLRYVDDTYTDSTSDRRRVGVRTRVTSALDDKTVRRGDVARIAGSVRPSHDGKTVYLQRYRDGAWRSVKSKALNGNSRYVFRLSTSSRGTYRYRVVRPADTDHLRGVSPRRVLSVE